MQTISRRILLIVILFVVSTVLVQTPAQGQAPGSESGSFLEERIYEPAHFMRNLYTDIVASAIDQGLPTWHLEDVIRDYYLIGYFSLVLGDDDSPHIIYVRDAAVARQVIYLYYDASGWQSQVVDLPARWFDPHPSLALDNDQNPHIVCPMDDQLFYAYRDGAVWKNAVIDSGLDIGLYPSIAVDTNGYLHVSYIDGGNGKLKYAKSDGVVWHIQTLSDAQVGDTSIVLDRIGYPHIGYAYNGGITYIYWNGAIWSQESAGGAKTSRVKYIPMALDTFDMPHFAYYNQDLNIAYTYRDALGWHTQELRKIDTTNRVYDSIVGLELDEANHPHIGYVLSSGNMYYISINEEGLIHEYVAGGYTGSLMADGLALNRYGQPSIAFFKQINSQLHVVRTTRADDFSGWAAVTFASYRDMNFEVYTADGDGDNPVRRTVNDATDYTPKYNRGATKIAFVSTRDSNPEVYTMHADGTHVTRLTTNNAGDYLPTWSPDNSKIAFYSLRDGNAEVYVMNANGTGKTRLTTNGAWDGHPTWSPDGSRIAFVSNRSGTYELWTMSADGSDQRQLSSGLGTAAYPDWSPDGSRFILNYDANGDGWLDLAVINADGTGLVRPLGNSPANYDYLAPVWSPDGAYVAFAKLQWIQYYGNWYWVDSYIKYVFDLNPNHVYTLLDSGYDWWPDWQPTDAARPSSQAFSPMWSASPTFSVQWSGHDNGLSGVDSYDVQYRDDATGVWTDWIIDTKQMQATFIGDYGHTYDFRSRARDVAGNVEAYPDGNGDASTHVYRYELSGHVLGNRDQPVVAMMGISPSALNTTVSGANGQFEFYFDDAGVYTLTAANPNFGLQPPMKHISVPGTLESPVFYLPPADDVIVDGDFELPNLTAWMPSGDIMPVITSTAHTGDGAVMLGGSGASTLIAPGGWRSVIEQEVAVPAVVTDTTLSLLYRVAEAEPTTDRLEVSLLGVTQTLTATLPLTVTGWAHHWWDLSAWSPQTATLQIAWYQSEMTCTAGILLDEISLGSALRGAYAIYLPLVFRDD